MENLSIVLIIAAMAAIIISISVATYYKYLYANLHRNFKKYQSYIDKRYIEVNVVLQNAVMEALEQAVDKENDFEVKAYTELFKKVKGKW